MPSLTNALFSPFDFYVWCIFSHSNVLTVRLEATGAALYLIIIFIPFQDKTLRMNELNGLRKQIEREYLEKVKLEDEIMEKMRSQLTLDKASQYTKKITTKKRDLTKQLVCSNS